MFESNMQKIFNINSLKNHQRFLKKTETFAAFYKKNC